MTEVWKGGKIIKISQKEKKALEQTGIPWWIVFTPTQLENRIRTSLVNMEIELNYDQIIEQRKEEFPVRKVAASTLKKKLIPFLCIDDNENITFYLNVGSFKNGLFVEQGLLGNGYEWEKLFLNFVRETKPESLEEIICDSEAGTFSVSSAKKMDLKKLALAFRIFCENEENFKDAMIKMNSG